MKAPAKKPKIKLTGVNGNAFKIINRVSLALTKSGADKEYVDKYVDDSFSSGSYNNLLCVARDYADIK